MNHVLNLKIKRTYSQKWPIERVQKDNIKRVLLISATLFLARLVHVV